MNKWGIPVVEPGTSIVKGRVTLDGKPVKAGHILYCYDKGISLTVGAITPTGTYETKLLSPGTATLCLVLDPTGKLPLPEQADLMGGGVPGGPMTPMPKGPGGPGGPPSGPPGGPNPVAGTMPPPPPGAPGGMGPRMPPGLPAHFVRVLRNFHLPQGEEATYQQLHLKYCKTDGNGLKVVIGPDVTTFDIALKP